MEKRTHYSLRRQLCDEHVTVENQAAHVPKGSGVEAVERDGC
jgi:hypothetical protein